MKNFISEMAQVFYDKIISNHYFVAFFIDKDMEKIKSKVTDYIFDQLVSDLDENSYKKAYLIGAHHSAQGIPLNAVIYFTTHIQNHIYRYCKDNPEMRSQFNIENLEVMKNYFAKGYLHDTINSTDMMSIPLFSVLSTTRVATSIISWITEINKVLLEESEDNEVSASHTSCDLIFFLDKPFFNMVFDSEDSFFEFNKMHLELHNTANSLLFFINEKNYIQTLFVYNNFIEQCKSFMNFYFERVVLFEQNNENYFYEFAHNKVMNSKEITLFTFNIRSMSMINKVWGHEKGDYIVNEIERVVDKKHGMNSTNSVFIKNHNAEFIVMMINQDNDSSLKEFNTLLSKITTSIPMRGEFHSDIKISSAYIPLGEKSCDYINHIKQIVQQAILVSKTIDNKPLLCDDDAIRSLNASVLHDEKIKYFIRQSFNKDNFTPFYHSIVTAENEETAHLEVLARVCDDKTCVSAGSFIDYLVVTERIIELDKIMLDKISDEINELRSKASKIFINISPKSLRSPSYIIKLNEFIKHADQVGIGTVFEITEQSLFDNIEIVKLLHTRYGSVFAIDDFGSGYSNFSIVSDLAEEGLIKYLKIDGSLIKDIHTNVYKENVVAGIIKIAESLNLKTIAEFVADKQTAEKLKSLGVSHLQGFHYALPKPLKDF